MFRIRILPYSQEGISLQILNENMIIKLFIWYKHDISSENCPGVISRSCAAWRPQMEMIGCGGTELFAESASVTVQHINDCPISSTCWRASSFLTSPSTQHCWCEDQAAVPANSSIEHGSITLRENPDIVQQILKDLLCASIRCLYK